MQQGEVSQTLDQQIEQQKRMQTLTEQIVEKPSKNDEQLKLSNISHLSVSSCPEKQQKQSSNDGLNSERSYPSSMSNYHQKNQPSENTQKDEDKKIAKPKKRPRKTSSHCLKSKTQIKEDTVQNEGSSDDDSQDSQLQYNTQGSRQGRKATITLVRMFLMICKKEYFYEVIRILVYALLSISIFSYVLDQNHEKKQFYEAFYSSEQITISKDINGVFPPLFGSQNDIVNHTWILESYNNHLMTDSEEIVQQSHEELLFQFKLSNVLYIRPNIETCVEQLKFRWKTFDYNMRIYEVLESEFQKIDDEESKSCFKNKNYMAEIMRQVSLWTIDWQSKQLYLLTEPFRDDKIEQSGNSKRERWNELIVLKKQSQKI